MTLQETITASAEYLRTHVTNRPTVALVLGSEGGGPGALTRKLCDAAVTLEMAPGQATGVDSYNVSVAAGILCYDVMRRRLAKK